MSSDVPIGWSFDSALAGHAFGRNSVQVEELSAEANQLARNLAQTRDRLLMEMAKSEAGIALANAMVDELKAEAAGQLAKRRLTDPMGREARRQFVDDVAEAELKRLSKGRLSFEPPKRNRL